MTKIATGAVLALLALLVIPLVVSSMRGSMYSSGTLAPTIGAIFAVLALGALIPRRR